MEELAGKGRGEQLIVRMYQMLQKFKGLQKREVGRGNEERKV